MKIQIKATARLKATEVKAADAFQSKFEDFKHLSPEKQKKFEDLEKKYIDAMKKGDRAKCQSIPKAMDRLYSGAGFMMYQAYKDLKK